MISSKATKRPAGIEKVVAEFWSYLRSLYVMDVVMDRMSSTSGRHTLPRSNKNRGNANFMSMSKVVGRKCEVDIRG